MKCSSVSVLSANITLARHTFEKWSWLEVNVYSLMKEEKYTLKKFKKEKTFHAKMAPRHLGQCCVRMW